MAFPYTPENLPLQHFVNNEYISTPADARLFSVHNPLNGSIVSDAVPIADAAIVEKAVEAAEAGFKVWKNTPSAEKQAIVSRFADLLEKHIQALTLLNRITQGAPKAGFGLGEAQLCIKAFRYYAGWADKLNGTSAPQNDDGFMKIVRYEPYGVTAGIVPWNGPLATVGFKAAPALVTGNCFILKPSEKTPFSALALGVLIKEAGFPAGVFQVLGGDGSTGELLARHMRIRKISFTGSVGVGKKVQQMAAESNLKRVTLELGGKSPAIVFEDANLDVAVKWLENAITRNSGQVCIAASRVYVHEKIYDTFLARYKAALEAKRAKMGDPNSDETEMGPLVDRAQFERVSGFIERAKKENAGSLLTGGGVVQDSTGFFVEPTVFTDISLESEIHRDEVFGPVSVVRKFSSEEEVMKIANDTEYGLMAGVFTQDINRALRVASDFESGMVGVNCMSTTSISQPFGGMKQSGLGRECGENALKSYVEAKTVLVNLTY